MSFDPLLHRLADMWNWLGGLHEGQATFLGWVVAFITLVGGALFNGHLNRKRDDRLRREDQRAVATALRAELVGLRDILTANAENLQEEHAKHLQETDVVLVVSDPTNFVRIMPEMVSKLGLLDETVISAVVHAHALLDEYCERLLLLGGRLREDVVSLDRRRIRVPADKVQSLIKLNTVTAEEAQKAITQLDACLRMR
jgi:hypothetical protein